MKSVLRASRIGRVLLRYRLDDLLEGTPVERWLKLARPFVPRASAEIAAQPRGARLRLALQELGPIFVKFGQILSTRRDLIPPDIAEELTLLQDRVAPFDGERARARVEQELARDIRDAFETFDTTPLASASIAQVHAATLPGGREVVVKVLRPDIGRQIAGDIALLESIAAIVERAHPNADKIRPREIVAEIENTLAAELDLQREAGNASLLRRNWAGSPDLYVPEVIWSHTAQGAGEGLQLHFGGECGVAWVIQRRRGAFHGFAVGARAQRQVDLQVQPQLLGHLVGKAVGGFGVVAVVHPHHGHLGVHLRDHVQDHGFKRPEVGRNDAGLAQAQGPFHQGGRVAAQVGVDGGEVDVAHGHAAFRKWGSGSVTSPW